MQLFQMVEPFFPHSHRHTHTHTIKPDTCRKRHFEWLTTEELTGGWSLCTITAAFLPLSLSSTRRRLHVGHRWKFYLFGTESITHIQHKLDLGGKMCWHQQRSSQSLRISQDFCEDLQLSPHAKSTEVTKARNVLLLFLPQSPDGLKRPASIQVLPLDTEDMSWFGTAHLTLMSDSELFSRLSDKNVIKAQCLFCNIHWNILFFYFNEVATYFKRTLYITSYSKWDPVAERLLVRQKV